MGAVVRVKPPVILSAHIAPEAVVSGDTVSVVVDWDAAPKIGARFQWRQGLTPIAGQTQDTFEVIGDEIDLNCLITIDNGIGTAITVAIFAGGVIPPPSGDFDPDDFTSDFVGGND